MIHVDARYLGLTANQLADIATDLKAENDKLQQIADGAANEADRLTHDAAALQIENAKLREQNAELLKLLEDMKNAPCCGNYCWMEIPQRLRDVGIEVPS